MILGLIIATQSGVTAEPKLSEDIDVVLKIRPRVEIVDSTKSATAFTNRLQIGLEAKNIANIDGLSVTFEATKVTTLIDDYHSASAKGSNFNPDKATVVDPPLTNFTKAFLRYKFNQTTIVVGEKPLNLDTQRFIGSVGWRQMPQTFGMFSASHQINTQLSVLGALLYRRNGIIPENDKGYRRGSGILHTEYVYSEPLKVTGYAYLLEDIHNTYGANIKGEVKAIPLIFSYRVEYALQRDPFIGNSNEIDIKTDYYNIEIGAKHHHLFSKIGYEVFGDKGNGSTGFSTPYATGHKFNGWSDVLLGKISSGNNDGLKDFNLTIGYASKSFGKSMLVYHKFDSVKNNTNFGSEIDFLYKKKILSQIDLLLKIALYDNGDNSSFVDTNKYWIMTTIGF